MINFKDILTDNKELSTINEETTKFGDGIKVDVKKGKMVDGPLGKEQEYIQTWSIDGTFAAKIAGSDRGVTMIKYDEDSVAYLLNAIFTI